MPWPVHSTAGRGFPPAPGDSFCARPARRYIAGMKVGTIPLYRGRDGLKVCMVSTAGSRRRFTFPKGVLRRREAWKKGALRELREEAGLSGRVLVPRYPLVLADRKRPSESVVLFWTEVLAIKGTWREDGLRRRKFLPADRMPGIKLGDMGRKVFREILKLDLGREPDAGFDAAGAMGRIRSRLLGLEARPDLDLAAGA